MKQVMVRYRVKPEAAAENERLVRAVYAALERERPDDLRYRTVVLDDGLTFVHTAGVEGDGTPLSDLEAFRAFQADIAGRCDEPPVVSDVREIGAYGV